MEFPKTFMLVKKTWYLQKTALDSIILSERLGNRWINKLLQKLPLLLHIACGCASLQTHCLNTFGQRAKSWSPLQNSPPTGKYYILILYVSLIIFSGYINSQTLISFNFWILVPDPNVPARFFTVWCEFHSKPSFEFQSEVSDL